MNDNELKPCPFCGGKAILRNVDDAWDSSVYVECQACGASTKMWPYVFEFEEPGAVSRAVHNWNKRECGKDE